MDSLRSSESGAALVMVLVITILLGTAAISLLSAAGASARNSTDVVSETKAYYAAESGIQAAVNALRNNGPSNGPVNYKLAVNNFTNGGNLSAYGLTYVTCDGTQRVTVDGSCENSYAVVVKDPDNSQSALGFGTAASFRPADVTGSFAANRTFASGVVLGFTPATTALAFDAGNPTRTTSLGTFTLTGVGAMDTATDFRIDYRLALPGTPGWVIIGTVSTAGAVNVLSSKYVVSGSEIEICGNNTSCGTVSSASPLSISAVVAPREPSRLLVTSKGFGPNRSNKVLEAIIQKTPLDGANSVSPFSMLGPCAEVGNPTNTAVFDAGTSNTTTYSGASSGGVNAPAFAFNAQCNLTTAEAYIAQYLTPNGQNQAPQVSPPPEYFDTGQLPEWQRSPLQMESKIQLYRARAQFLGTYYNPHPGPKITNPGYVAGQTGPNTNVTFCEGDCTVDGDLGGGILVVTGKLDSLGGFGFRGLIIVTGPNGWERKGGGCGEITGNVVISPYTSSNLSSNVFTLPPKYEITGGGCSGVSYANLDDLFEGENSALTNFIQGVAEK